MRLKKNDNVLIMKGKDKGKKGKILTVFPKQGKIIVENANMLKKHQRPKKEGEKGQVIQIAAPINASNVEIICTKCGKQTRIGYLKGVRICKKCKGEI